MVELGKILMAVVLVGVRVSGLLIFAPVLGGEALPSRVKIGLAIALTALLYPACAPHVVTASATLPNWLALVVGELTVGLLLGLSLHFVFDAMQLAGQVLGVQVGFGLVNVIDPQTQVDTPVLSTFHQMIATLIFLRLDVHHWLLRGVARSFAYVPPGEVAASSNLASSVLHAAGALWLAGLQIAAPALFATMLADVALGFVGKASPQLPVLFVGLSVKSVLGILFVAAGLGLWPGLLEKYFAGAIAGTERLLQLVH
jgi:flagellar biosynthetic protein FliR